MFCINLIRLNMFRIVGGHEVDDLKLLKPFRLIVAGGSDCGKSQIAKQIVDNDYFESSFDRIIYNYPHYKYFGTSLLHLCI